MAEERGLAIITARGGSKGLPGKNLRTIAGRSLVARAVEAGTQSGRCFRVLCTTDSAEIGAEAARAGAEVIDRPPALATDEARSFDVVRHALEACNGHGAPWFVLLQPTSPLRNAEHVCEAVDRLVAGVNSVVSVVRAAAHPYKCLLVNDGEEVMPVREWEDLERPRQRLPTAWHPNGAIYVCRPRAFLTAGGFFPRPMALYPMDASVSIDIDVAADLELAEFLARPREAR